MKIWIDEEELDFSRYQLFDCRNQMDDIEQSLATFNLSHIETAIFVPGYPILYDRHKPEEGRHPLPDMALFQSFIKRHCKDKIPVAYDSEKGFMATRFFFLCDLIGVSCYILKQSFNEMTIAKEQGNLKLEDISQLANERQIDQPVIRQELLATREDVRNQVATLIDAREEKRFLGEAEPIDIHPGRIPGALNFPYKKVFEYQRPDTDDAIVYCGSGLSATPVYAALRAADKNVKLYPGSYSEWIFHYPEDIERG